MTRRRWWRRRRRRKTRHNGLECIVCVNIVGPCHIIPCGPTSLTTRRRRRRRRSSLTYSLSHSLTQQATLLLILWPEESPGQAIPTILLVIAILLRTAPASFFSSIIGCWPLPYTTLYQQSFPCLLFYMASFHNDRSLTIQKSTQ